MHIVLWDTRKLDVSKDFAGGFGIGQYVGDGSFRSRIIRRGYKRDYRPASLLFAYLAAIFARLGHRVEYAEDRLPADADLYVFNPSLLTLHLEHDAIAGLLERRPSARVLVVGTTASVMPEAFADLSVTVVKGEAEQLLWKLDEVLAKPGASVQLGVIDELDQLPFPDWSPFKPRRFRIGYDFWRFPTALVQASRGCSMKCNYCPYLVLDNSTRFRSPESVVAEIEQDIRRWGFRSFKFRDPLFGLNRQRVVDLAERIGRLPHKIQFSIETRIDLLPGELLRLLKSVGLTSITVGIESPDDKTLRHYRRAPIQEDRQREFILMCRSLGIRTVAGFLIGFPDDTEESISRVRDYAQQVNPTFANFNVVTPYPGTAFFEHMRGQIADTDVSHYTVYTPVLKYEHLTTKRMNELLAKCFHRFYFRWQYLRDNAPLLWPLLGKLGVGRRRAASAASETGHHGVPRPLSGVEVLQRKGLRPDGPHLRGNAAGEPDNRRADQAE
jgi:radical SAM superfamily enzyme YgiQ (UPF0313 family)